MTKIPTDCTTEAYIQEMEAYCGHLRQVLRDLVFAVDSHRCDVDTPVEKWLYGMRMELEFAEMALRMETGRHAEQIMRGMEKISIDTYVLADYAHMALYGTPRGPSPETPTRAEVADALQDIEVLTKENRHLYGLLVKETSL